RSETLRPGFDTEDRWLSPGLPDRSGSGPRVCTDIGWVGSALRCVQTPARGVRRNIQRGIQAMLRSRVGAALLIFGGLGVETAAAQSQWQVNAGRLVCRTGPGIGALIASRRRLNCLFRAGDGHTERYAGSVTRFGLDVGATAGGVMT